MEKDGTNRSGSDESTNAGEKPVEKIDPSLRSEERSVNAMVHVVSSLRNEGFVAAADYLFTQYSGGLARNYPDMLREFVIRSSEDR